MRSTRLWVFRLSAFGSRGSTSRSCPRSPLANELMDDGGKDIGSALSMGRRSRLCSRLRGLARCSHRRVLGGATRSQRVSMGSMCTAKLRRIRLCAIRGLCLWEGRMCSGGGRRFVGSWWTGRVECLCRRRGRASGVLTERSVKLVSLWAFGRSHAPTVEGQALQEEWKPELEGHPRGCCGA